MPTREHAPVGAPCWVDLSTSDVDHARAFYSELFGWTPGEPSPEFGGYFMFLDGGVPVAGAAPRMGDEPPPDGWMVYLCVEDMTRTIVLAEASAGHVATGPMSIADMGTMALIRDASGAAVGAWQPGTFAGFTRYGEVGTPIWFELLSRDYPSAVAFYKSTFDWTTETMSDTAEFRYTVALNDGEYLAGVMDASAMLPDGTSSHWSTYFGVSDVDRIVEAIVNLGGSVTVEPHDSPYGRLAGVTDPMGAPFSVMAR